MKQDANFTNKTNIDANNRINGLEADEIRGRLPVIIIEHNEHFIQNEIMEQYKKNNVIEEVHKHLQV